MIKLIGYGNPARGDDGLGPAFARRIVAPDIAGLEVRIDYQLSVDHALWIADADIVVFADASLASHDAYAFTPVAPAPVHGLASHTLNPGAVMALAETLYGATPQAFTLGIAGRDFEGIHEGLSDPAQANLDAAVSFFEGWVKGPQTVTKNTVTQAPPP